MTFSLLMVAALLAPRPALSEVQESLHRIEQIQAEVRADLKGLKEDIAEVKGVQAQQAGDIGTFYRQHHIPTRSEWSTVVHRPTHEKTVGQVAALSRTLDYLLGGLAVVLAIFGWIMNSVRLEVKHLSEPPPEPPPPRRRPRRTSPAGYAAPDVTDRTG